MEIMNKIKEMIKPSVGSMDQKIRLIIGITLMLLYLGDSIGSWGAAASALLIISGIKRVCFLYKVCKINTLNDKIEKN
jgi:hypothetical protein